MNASQCVGVSASAVVVLVCMRVCISFESDRVFFVCA